MPKLAAKLGVRAPSLYHYFADKDAVLAAVAQVVAIPAPTTATPADADWTDHLVSQAVALRATIVAHPQCAPLLVRFMPRDNMFGGYEPDPVSHPGALRIAGEYHLGVGALGGERLELVGGRIGRG